MRAKSGTASKRRKTGENGGGSINFGPIGNWVGFNLRRAQDSSFRAFSRGSQDAGEKPGRFVNLTLIARNPGISQAELSLASGRDQANLAPILDDLVQRGLVSRTRMNGDRWASRLSLTPEGRKILTKLTRSARRHELKLEAMLGRSDCIKLVQILKRISTEIS